MIDMQTKLIEGKNALITGGGRGIGKAVALEFAKNGANVAISARSEDELNKTIREIESYGVKGLSIVADLSTVDGINACADNYLNHFEVCDILVNNAGFSQYHSILEYSIEEFQYLFNLNVMSYFLMTKRMLPGMLEQKSGKIINILSKTVRIKVASSALVLTENELNETIQDYFDQIKDITIGNLESVPILNLVNNSIEN